MRPGDAAALAGAAARLAADPAARAAQGRAARERVLARTWTAVGDALIGQYTAVLAGDQELGQAAMSRAISAIPCPQEDNWAAGRNAVPDLV